jgi:RNase H-like domain found in reverse transcriptase/Reverse transcriptase (RNA-dependent DNA polymerase)/gag-polyprotein putative aspartyl protease
MTSHMNKCLPPLTQLKAQDIAFDPDAYAQIGRCLGRPCTIDVAADCMGVTSKCSRFLCPARSFFAFDGYQPNDCLWVNPPFHALPRWIQHYRALKTLHPDLSACFVQPRTPALAADSSVQWLRDLPSTRTLIEFPANKPLFTRPDGSTFAMTCPVQVLYDPPAGAPNAPVMPHLRTLPHADGPPPSSMIFHAKVAGTQLRALMDTGATESFMDNACRMRMGLPLQPCSHPHVTFADKSTAPLVGQCTVPLRLGALRAHVTCMVLDNLSHAHDLILGMPFLTTHSAVIDIAARIATFTSGKRRIVVAQPKLTDGDVQLHAADVPWENVDFDPAALARKHELLTAKQGFRALLNGEQFFLAHLKLLPGAPPPELHAYAHGDVKPGPVPQAELNAVLTDYADVFAPIPPGLPPDRGVPHVIPLTSPDVRPVVRPIYRLSAVEEQEARKQISELLEKGWIRPSQSPWAAPILFAPKPDGTLRMVVDYRGLNQLTVRNAYPMPRIDVLLDRLKGHKVFSSIDLQSAYHQIRLADDDIPKTAWRCTLGHFEYTVMPMGARNSGATWQVLADRIYKPLIDRGIVTVYQDDILIHSRSAQEHVQHLREALDVLRQHKLYAKASKCEWNRTEVTFLGHLVGADGIRMDPSKVDVIQKWPQPTTQSELRSFLGLANYFRKFIAGYASIAAPLHDLLKNSAPAKFGNAWTPDHAAAFDLIKNMIAKDVILQYPDLTKPFTVISDASLLGTGAVLLQDGRPVAFTSKKLSGAERNYATGEQELLGVINALTEWRYYLEGPQVTLVTDG